MTLRQRIALTLIPLFVLLALLGGTGIVLLSRLGGSIDLILRENYVSVIAMKDLNEALERIDSSFQFTLAGRLDKGLPQYRDNWKLYLDHLHVEQENITLPDEPELVDELLGLTDTYRRQGNAFYALPYARFAGTVGTSGASPLQGLPDLSLTTETQQARDLYFKEPGLLQTFKEIKTTSGKIAQINHENMEQADREAREAASTYLAWFAAGLGGVALLAGVLVWQTVRTVLRPIRAVTESALAIGTGNLDQVVPVLSRDELGTLAEAFNTMARQLRHYRQTQYAQLLRAQRTSQATIDSFPHPVLVVDGEGRVEMANPAARHLLGVASRDGSTGGDGATVWQPPERLRKPLAEAVHEQREYSPDGFDQAVSLNADGKERFYLPRILPIRDRFAQTLGAAVLLEDVTRFQLLDQVKSNLVATASHELKTPLTGVRLAVHLLLEEKVGPLTAKQTELLLDARDNAERLLSMVNELLDLARLERGQQQLDLRPEQPATLLETAAEAIRPRAADKGLEVVVERSDALPEVNADAHRLGHALENILNNAVTYTDRGGRITLRARAAADHVILEVKDTGCGIPPEYLPHLFEKFYRVPGRSQGQGTGLGLAIVREIVTAHGGTVSCESQVGKGTLFRLTLPVRTDSNSGGGLQP
jgi:signal transduction histidine kinase